MARATQEAGPSSPSIRPPHSTPQGRMLASVMASFGQFERELIAMRTRDALAARASH